MTPYFKTLSGQDQKAWYARNLHQKRALGIDKYSAETSELLRTSLNSGRNMIYGIPNYEILSNHYYRAAFNYTTLEFRDTKGYRMKLKIKDQIKQAMELRRKGEESPVPIEQKYDFGTCDKHNHQIDFNDLLLRVLNPGSCKLPEKTNFSFKNHTRQVIEDSKKFSLKLLVQEFKRK